MTSIRQTYWLNDWLHLLWRALALGIAVWGWVLFIGCRIDVAEATEAKTAALSEQGACWASFDVLDVEIRGRWEAYEHAHAALYERLEPVPVRVEAQGDDGS